MWVTIGPRTVCKLLLMIDLSTLMSQTQDGTTLTVVARSAFPQLLLKIHCFQQQTSHFAVNYIIVAVHYSILDAHTRTTCNSALHKINLFF